MFLLKAATPLVQETHSFPRSSAQDDAPAILFPVPSFATLILPISTAMCCHNSILNTCLLDSIFSSTCARSLCFL